MDKLICYCFEYTIGDIKDDYKQNKKSLILEKIMGEKKQDACNCAAKNPKGK